VIKKTAAAKETPSIRILLVEDEAIARLHLAQFLTDEGFSVVPLASGEEALKIMETENFDAVICDFKLPGAVDGISVLTEFDRRTPGRPKLLVSAYSPDQLRAGIEAVYVAKPIDLDDLLLKLKSALP
jgi:two-component system nitrogen regulation response regulator NtrX